MQSLCSSHIWVLCWGWKRKTPPIMLAKQPVSLPSFPPQIPNAPGLITLPTHWVAAECPWYWLQLLLSHWRYSVNSLTAISTIALIHTELPWQHQNSFFSSVFWGHQTRSLGTCCYGKGKVKDARPTLSRRHWGLRWPSDPGWTWAWPPLQLFFMHMSLITHSSVIPWQHSCWSPTLGPLRGGGTCWHLGDKVWELGVIWCSLGMLWKRDLSLCRSNPCREDVL